MSTKIRFDIFTKRNLGTIYKSNEIDTDGIDVIVNIPLVNVDYVEVNYKISNVIVYTDTATIVDIEKGIINVPFKSDVIPIGTHQFELVAYMLNGDVETSQTCMYIVEKAIGKGIQAGDNGNGDSGNNEEGYIHNHVNLTILNSITQENINEWNAKANISDIPTKVSQLTNDSRYLTNVPSGYATENYVKNEIAKAQLEGEEIDLSGYATKDELNAKANVSDIPTKVSDLDNDSNYLTSIPNEYITETELNNKGYLTEHQDISHLATKNELEGLATETFVKNAIADAQLGGNDTEIDLSGYVTEDELNAKNYLTNDDISHLATKDELFSKNYNDLTNKPTIPTKTSQLTNDSNYLNSIPSEYITEDKLNAKNYLTNDDISHLATKDELFSKNYNDLTNKPTIPTKVSQLTNDSNYLTSIPNEYVTETELNEKGYLTEHQDISHLASKTELFNKDYNDLINKPTIPSIEGLATETFVKNAIADAQLGGNDTEIDLSGYVTDDELASKGYLTDDNITHLASKSELFSGNYNDLTNKPNIPSIEGLASEQYVTNAINGLTIPTKVSDLTNDSEYITETELNQKGYLTEHQNINHLALKTELHSHDNKTVIDNITSTMITNWNNKSDFDGNYNNLTNKPSIPSIEGLATETYVDNAIDDLTIPTKISDLTNDSGFISSIPSEYITEDELNGKGYLTEHQDISHLATKTELNKKANISSVPTKVSELTNDSNYLTSIPSEYITETELDNMGYLTNSNISHLATKDDLSTKADTSSIPTKVSQLTNDSNYLTSIPSEYITETELNNMGYLTNNNISHLATKTELNEKANASDVPTKTSQLTNDSNYLTSIPSEYITEAELNNMGYLTNNNISHLATKDELNVKVDKVQGYSLISDSEITRLSKVDNYIHPTTHSADMILFSDGETFQNKLNSGSLKGDKGDKGDKGEQGEQGIQGEQGNDGLTTSINVNGSTYNHSNGVITLPNYPTSLPAYGGNSDTVNGFSIWSGTQAQFDSISSKSNNTIYLIKED